MLPIGRGRFSPLTEPVSESFAFVGDAKTGIWAADSLHVYVDFDLLQKLVDMDVRTDEHTGRVDPARASQIMVKTRPGLSERELAAVAEQVGRKWDELLARHPDYPPVRVESRTWRQKQASLPGPHREPADAGGRSCSASSRWWRWCWCSRSST